MGGTFEKVERTRVMTDDLRKVGYWYSEREPHLPMPLGSYEPHPDKLVIVTYLKEHGEELIAWRGFSRCRICGEVPPGTRCMTDGVYQWPEGLWHYVEEHNVHLPTTFVDHIKNQILRECFG